MEEFNKLKKNTKKRSMLIATYGVDPSSYDLSSYIEEIYVKERENRQ